MTTTKYEIVLYGFPKPVESIPSPSGYVQKVETFLRATEFKDYKHVYTQASSGPKKKLPYIELKATASDGETSTTIIPDSHFIIRHLVSNGISPDLDASLTRSEKADSRAWISYTEEFLYTAVVTTRWHPDRPGNYAAIYSQIPIPGLIKPLLMWYLRRNINHIMWTAGMGRHSAKELDSFLAEWVENLDAKLEGREWFFGKDKPTLVDVVNCGFLLNSIGVGNGNSEFLALLKEKPVILAWVEKRTKEWFPEYENVLEFVKS